MLHLGSNMKYTTGVTKMVLDMASLVIIDHVLI